MNTATTALLKVLLPTVVLSAAVGGAVGHVAGTSAGRSAAQREQRAQHEQREQREGRQAPRRAVDFAAAGTGQGAMEVTSVPKNARVTLDGRIVGRTPIHRLDADPGTHAVVMELDGYQPFMGSVRVAEGGGLSVHAVLEKLVIMVDPPAAAAAAPAVAPRPTQPARPTAPKIDCAGNQSSCKSRCDSTETHCEMTCRGCSSCTTDLGWDKCREMCESCKQGCQQNEDFCVSGCDGQYDACRGPGN